MRTAKKTSKKGVPFNLLVVGDAGLGRTAFVNTLCEKPLIRNDNANFDPSSAASMSPVEVIPYQTDITLEDGFRISLTILDTPHFNEAIDNENNFDIILQYVESQYDNVLEEETRIKRNAKFCDDRVHALIYFISPTGHGLRELDIELMKRLAPRVNVIPVVAKADSLTAEELKATKQMILDDIAYYHIPVYNFPYDEEEDDEALVSLSKSLRSKMPFAIVSSDRLIDINGSTIRGRAYPWGVVDVDNPSHSDFLALRSAIFSSHLEDLQSITNNQLYETYRTEKLSASHLAMDSTSSFSDVNSGNQQDQVLREDRLRAIELSVQREIEEKRRQLLAREDALRALEEKIAASTTAMANTSVSTLPSTANSASQSQT
ncbi:septin Spn3 [Schizosaccharomyces cryophilus OY26]|uniref:Septin Spn3 n=1 Tax=Schizosaccharomyces cryophilus (strain OY26 / ATCC MYA-4695 / CBS 11777 / NBRC 106824 / NRRL Y48691) TaxID=653667 RepID=S9W3V9_SCHCR|nr:septin Spn3 [Schizosaccharomyces cryophilus OY26]EPY52635.1 septin Spn3 [Schizosaccharomyces cryophilus OY26]